MSKFVQKKTIICNSLDSHEIFMPSLTTVLAALDCKHWRDKRHTQKSMYMYIIGNTDRVSRLLKVDPSREVAYLL